MVGIPSGRVLPLSSFGISTSRTGGGKYEPDDIRFQILYRLLSRSCSNAASLVMRVERRDPTLRPRVLANQRGEEPVPRIRNPPPPRLGSPLLADTVRHDGAKRG